MPDIILFDDPVLRTQLLPFTYTRPVAGIRIGIHTIAEKWMDWLQSPISYQTERYLSPKFGIHTSADNVFVNGSLCPDENLAITIHELPFNTALSFGTNTKFLLSELLPGGTLPLVWTNFLSFPITTHLQWLGMYGIFSPSMALR
jgi:hypothetical protein